MKISDIADIINVSVKDPSKSGIDVFVGLEHYDIAEPVIKRCGSTKMLSTAAKKFEAGDVLIARRNVYLQRAAVARFSGLTSGDSIILRVKENLSTKDTDYETMCKLLPFVLNSINFWDYANTNADGTMSKRLSPAMLLEYEFNLPSIDEQKVLADKLWAAYEVKQSYLRMIEATEKMVKSQFIEMFNGDYHKEKWEECMSITNGKKYEGEYQETGTFPICGSGGVMGYGESKLCNKDTVILGRKGNINSPIYMSNDYWIVDTAFSLDVDRQKLQPKYFFFWCKQFDFTKYNKQGVLPSLTKNDLLKIEMPIPPMELQNKFVAILEQADKSENVIHKSIETIDQDIKSLINENL